MRAPFPTKKQTSSRTCQLSIVIVHEARSELDIGLQLEQISEVPKSAICIFFNNSTTMAPFLKMIHFLGLPQRELPKGVACVAVGSLDGEVRRGGMVMRLANDIC